MVAMGWMFQYHLCSGLFDLAGELFNLLSGFWLPWPPSSWCHCLFYQNKESGFSGFSSCLIYFLFPFQYHIHLLLWFYNLFWYLFIFIISFNSFIYNFTCKLQNKLSIFFKNHIRIQTVVILNFKQLWENYHFHDIKFFHSRITYDFACDLLASMI